MATETVSEHRWVLNNQTREVLNFEPGSTLPPEFFIQETSPMTAAFLKRPEQTGVLAINISKTNHDGSERIIEPVQLQENERVINGRVVTTDPLLARIRLTVGKQQLKELEERHAEMDKSHEGFESKNEGVTEQSAPQNKLWSLLSRRKVRS